MWWNNPSRLCGGLEGLQCLDRDHDILDLTRAQNSLRSHATRRIDDRHMTRERFAGRVENISAAHPDLQPALWVVVA